MKHFIAFIASVVFCTTTFTSKAQRSNCAALPTVNIITQPNGSKISLRAHGNEAIHYLETEDGYTVLQNQQGYYEYATTDQNGNLALSGSIVSETVLPKTALPKYLRYSAEQRSLLLQYFNQTNAEANTLGKAANPLPFPPTGNRKVLVLLVEYPDLKATIPLQDFELLLNQPNYNGTGSFKDYYLATSNGKLNLTSTVYGWLMADSGYKYYRRGNTGNPNPSYNSATRSLLLGAVKDAKDSFNVDFSQFDNDNDGFCDGVIIMHAGIGAEEASAPNSSDYIWSFRSTLSEEYRPTYDGVFVAAYAMFPEKRWESGAMNMVGIGVLAHEFGHLLDLPDLYSTNDNNEGAGNYCLMAGGPWLNSENTPCFNDAWSRIQMGWVTPVVLTDTQIYTLPYAVVDSDMVFRINTPRANEYYLLENRQQKKFDAFLPAKGLAIWHINTNNAILLSKASGNKRNNVNNDTSQLGVGLIQADGQRHLERNAGRGDAFDLYPINNNKNFAPKSNPQSNLHYKLNNAKQPSGVAVTDIVQMPDSSIVFEFGMNASSAFSVNRSFGCNNLPFIFTPQIQESDSLVWDFGNGTTSNQVKDTVYYKQPGNYYSMLNIYKKGKLVDTSGLTIRILETPEIDYTTERDSLYNVTFINKTKYGSTYNWRFGFDTTVAKNGPIVEFSKLDTNPVVAVHSPRYMWVTLTAKSKDNCITSRKDSIVVFPLGIKNEAHQLPLQVFPNPAKSVAYIQFNLPQTSQIQMAIFNVAGSLVYAQNMGKLQSGSQQINLNIDELAPGMYWVQITAGSSMGIIKIVKE